jgi:hypothetical protein
VRDADVDPLQVVFMGAPDDDGVGRGGGNVVGVYGRSAPPSAEHPMIPAAAVVRAERL